MRGASGSCNQVVLSIYVVPYMCGLGSLQFFLVGCAFALVAGARILALSPCHTVASTNQMAGLERKQALV